MVLILGFALRKPLAEFLVSRSDALSKEIREAEAEAKKSAADLAHWEGKMQASKEEVAQHEADVRAQLEKQKAESATWTASEIERIGKESELVAESEKNRAKAGIQREVAHRSLAAARAYIEGHVSEKDRKQLVNEYLEIVGNAAR